MQIPPAQRRRWSDHPARRARTEKAKQILDFFLAFRFFVVFYFGSGFSLGAKHTQDRRERKKM
jgi:hypothetical protein